MVHVQEYKITRGLCPSSVVLFQPPVIQDLLFEEIEDKDGNKSVHCCRDIRLLLNSERLKGLGDNTIKAYIDSLAPYSDGLQQLKSKISDNDLISCVKSRYMQSQSELAAWIDHLTDRQQEILASLQKQDVSDSSDDTDSSSVSDSSGTSSDVSSK